MMNFINNIKGFLVGFVMTEEEYKKALWEHEQIGYRLHSVEIAIEELKR